MLLGGFFLAWTDFVLNEAVIASCLPHRYEQWYQSPHLSLSKEAKSLRLKLSFKGPLTDVQAPLLNYKMFK